MTSDQMKAFIRDGFQYMFALKTADALRYNHGYSHGQIGLASSAMLISSDEAQTLFDESDEIYKKAFDSLQHRV